MATVRDRRTEEAEGPWATHIRKTGNPFRILFLPMIDNPVYLSEKSNSLTHITRKAGVQLEAGMPMLPTESDSLHL